MHRFWRRMLIANASIFGVAFPACAGSFPQSLQIEIGGSYAVVSPDEVNDFLRNPNYFITDDGFESIDAMGGVNIAVRQALGSGFGLRVGGGYLRGATNTKELVARNTEGEVIGKYEQQYRLSSIPILLGFDYRIYGGTTAVRAEIAAEYYFVEFGYDISENKSIGAPEYNVQFKESGIGANVSLCVERQLTAYASIGSRVGYRVTEKVKLIGGAGSWPAVTTDLSGFEISLFLGLRPWS